MTQIETSWQPAAFEFQLKNVGSKEIQGCLGPSYGWEFDGQGDEGAIEVIVGHSGLDFRLKPGEVYTWEEKIHFLGAPAGARAHFYFDIYRRKCKGKVLYRVRSESTNTQLEDVFITGEGEK
jgi:hypothetical protein